MTTRPLGSQLAIITGTAQYGVPVADYWRVVGLPHVPRR